MTSVKACCGNCGYVCIYEVPYRSLIFSAIPGDDSRSYVQLESGRRLALICVNCGWDRLEMVYWDGTVRLDPFIGEQLRRLNDDTI